MTITSLRVYHENNCVLTIDSDENCAIAFVINEI